MTHRMLKTFKCGDRLNTMAIGPVVFICAVTFQCNGIESVYYDEEKKLFMPKLAVKERTRYLLFKQSAVEKIIDFDAASIHAGDYFFTHESNVFTSQLEEERYLDLPLSEIPIDIHWILCHYISDVLSIVSVEESISFGTEDD